MLSEGTIIALSTPSGTGALAILRLSGPQAITQCAKLFRAASGASLDTVASHTIHLGHLYAKDQMIDEVLVSVFRNPRSYTGEDVVEISCHGSQYIQQAILNAFIANGIRPAQAGEFTLRAFINGKMDLTQAEAVADVIAAENEASHKIALQQMRGGISKEIRQLRKELLDFASLIELELDFAEEDVDFADRKAFELLLQKIQRLLKGLIDSFALGNVIKKGVPVAIIGAPNAGKSTLLNTLLKEDKAIISAIAGTTRDSIEDEINVQGIGFRFIDTAGIRETTDEIEQIGIQKAYEKISLATIILYMIDSTCYRSEIALHQEKIEELKRANPNKKIIIVFNKADLLSPNSNNKLYDCEVLEMSAKNNVGVTLLKDILVKTIKAADRRDEGIITNSRHYAALIAAQDALAKVQNGLEENLSGDLLAIDLREALYQLGAVTGEVTNDELLGNIFANFCIGK